MISNFFSRSVAGYSSCGVSSFDFRSHIVGGNKSKKGWWPWTVGIYKLDGNNHGISCRTAVSQIKITVHKLQ